MIFKLQKHPLIMKEGARKTIKVLNKLIVYLFFISGVILLFYGTGRTSTILIAFGSFIASIFFSWLLKVKKYQIYTGFL